VRAQVGVPQSLIMSAASGPLDHFDYLIAAPPWLVFAVPGGDRVRGWSSVAIMAVGGTSRAGPASSGPASADPVERRSRGPESAC
jgi:hypothetical protein